MVDRNMKSVYIINTYQNLREGERVCFKLLLTFNYHTIYILNDC